MLSYSQNFLRQFSIASFYNPSTTFPDSELVFNFNTLGDPDPANVVLEFKSFNNCYSELDTSTPSYQGQTFWILEDEPYKILKQAFINLAENVNAFRNDGIGVLFDDSDRFRESFSMETPKISQAFCDLNIGNDFDLGQYKFKQVKFIDYKMSRRDPNAFTGDDYKFDLETCFNTPVLHFGKSFANVPWVFGLNPRVYRTCYYSDNGNTFKFNGLIVCLNPYARQVTA